MNLIGIKNTGDVLTAAEVNAIGQGITAPAAPTLTRVGGATGNPVFSSSAVIERTANMVLYKLVYTVTPGATGYAEHQIAFPSGWVGAIESFGIYPPGTGLPDAVAVNSPNIVVNYAAVTLRNITLTVLAIKL